MPTLTVKISQQLRSRLAAAAKHRRITQSELVRQAIETSLREDKLTGPSAYDLIADLIEKLPKPKGPPTNRSTRPDMSGFGLDGPAYREWLRRGRRRAR